MKLKDQNGHLTYCLNIHPTQTWNEVKDALLGPVAKVKSAVCPDAPFAVGLRFSGEALDDLSDPEKRTELKELLEEQSYLAITVNGFPYGRFHGARVKEEVYQPDWCNDERVRYTCALADLMAEIAPAGEMISLSTVPGTFKPLSKGAEANMAENYLLAVAHLAKLKAKTGVRIALAIEPEPFCFLETIAETIDYFESYLFSTAAVARLAELTGLTRSEAGRALPEHLGLCYDVCHAAVEYEDPAGSIAALRKAGIPIHKLQLSTALLIPNIGPAERAALADFDEPTYLHQVIRNNGDGLKIHVDLPDALALGTDSDGEEWRVHFHVPIFLDDLGAFSSTRDFLEQILALHKVDPISPHLEIETYTWDVLPGATRGQSVDQDIVRELNWVRGQLLQ
jgi:hypothetical protein